MLSPTTTDDRVRADNDYKNKFNNNNNNNTSTATTTTTTTTTTTNNNNNTNNKVSTKHTNATKNIITTTTTTTTATAIATATDVNRPAESQRMVRDVWESVYWRRRLCAYPETHPRATVPSEPRDKSAASASCRITAASSRTRKLRRFRPGDLPSLCLPYIRASRSIAVIAAIPPRPIRPEASKTTGDTLSPYLLRFSVSPAAAAMPPRLCAAVYLLACAHLCPVRLLRVWVSKALTQADS